MEVIVIRVLFLMLLLIGPKLGIAVEYDTTKWQAAIEKFAVEDAAHPTSPGGVVFVGSSSIRMWDLEKSFPGKNYLNRGFGGSEIADSTHYFDELVAKHKPRLVVFYAGDNDIANGKSSEQVHQDFQAFIEKFKTELPKANLLYISIKPSIARWHLADKMREANKLIEDDGNRRPHFHFLDVWPVMLDAQGKPREDIFLGDGLHLNEVGYQEWAKLVEPLLK